MKKLITDTSHTTIGCDPEVFLLHKGQVVPAVGLIGGSKESPVPVAGGALQEDNVMAEFNTTPVTSVEEFIKNIELVYGQIESIADKYQLEVGVYASKKISRQVLHSCDKAQEFGCDPDFNAYSMDVNPTPDPTGLLRTCAGHIHIGYDVEGGHSFETSAELVRYLDAYVGTYCVINDPDTRRMSKYGKAGAFRPKPYGTEYRVPSNFWIKSRESIARMFHQVRIGYDAAKRGLPLPSNVEEAINTHNVELCKEILYA